LPTKQVVAKLEMERDHWKREYEKAVANADRLLDQFGRAKETTQLQSAHFKSEEKENFATLQASLKAAKEEKKALASKIKKLKQAYSERINYAAAQYKNLVGKLVECETSRSSLQQQLSR
jgi:hypothetical protein